jgi:hypothetical protein
MIENQFARIALTLGPLIDLLSPLPPRDLSRPRRSSCSPPLSTSGAWHHRGSVAVCDSHGSALRISDFLRPSLLRPSAFPIDLAPGSADHHQLRNSKDFRLNQRISKIFKPKKLTFRYRSARRPRLRVQGASRPVWSLPRYAPQPAFGTAALGRARIPM